MDDIPIFSFSPEKNLKLKSERNISFEEIIATIDNGQLIDILGHPNTKKYANQQIYVVQTIDYIYLVPVVAEKKGSLIMKTIIPSRKAVQKYFKGKKNEKKNS